MPSVVIVATDLMFTSKVTGTAQALGIDAASAATVDALAKQLESHTVRLVLVDMSMPEPVPVEALRTAGAHASRPATIAFYSHVQSALADAAKAAGASDVMPRSKFSADLPAILNRYGKPQDQIS
ncbi:MAG: hypothetical protein HZA51_01175 [Planctomycetes bacterium]|nr:hypothetical protein [Planctomycetota bacterium]